MSNPLKTADPIKLAYVGGCIVTANEDGSASLNSKVIATVDECADQNIVAICEQFNMHYELVKSLKRWVAQYETECGPFGLTPGRKLWEQSKHLIAELERTK